MAILKGNLKQIIVTGDSLLESSKDTINEIPFKIGDW